MQEDDIKDIYHVALSDSILIHTRGGSLLLYDLNTGFNKVVLRNHVFAVSLNETRAQPTVAVLRTAALTKAFTASVYAIERRYLKLVWECKIEVDQRSPDTPSIAFIEAPMSLVVCAHGNFVWVGMDPVTQRPKSRVVLMNQGDGYSRVVQVPGRDGQALMVSDDIGIMVDRNGDPIGNSIPLSGLEAPVHDIAVWRSLIIVVTSFCIYLIDIDRGTRNKEELVDPQGWFWKLGTSSQSSPNLPMSLHCGTHVWIICTRSLTAQLQRAIEEKNAVLGRTLVNRHPELMTHYNLMKECSILFMQQGFVRDGLNILEKFTLENQDPTCIFYLFPRYMKHYLDPPSDLQSSDPIWGEQEIKDAPALNNDLESILEYLFRVREFPGISKREGIDTLILHLLIDLDMKDAAVAFLSAPNHAVPKDLANRLESQKWRQPLALLCKNDPEYLEKAISLWKSLCEEGGEDREEALGQIQLTLSDASICRPELVMEHVPWLLDNGYQSSALEIIHSRPDMPVDGVLKILPDVFLKCQYLQIAISGGENRTNSYVHTELALALIQIIIKYKTDQKIPEFSDAIKTLDDLTEANNRSPATFVARSFQNMPKPHTMLHQHLVRHAQYIDIDFIFGELSETMIHEKAIIAATQNDHDEVIRILVNSCSNIPAAIEYIKAFIPSEHQQDMLMNHILNCNLVQPWDIAGQLIASFDTCTIVASNIVDRMPDGMELCNGEQALTRIMQSIIHRRREKEMKRALLRRRLFSMKTATKDWEQANPCNISEQSSCKQCSLKIGNTACVQVHNKGVLCLHCFKNKM